MGKTLVLQCPGAATGTGHRKLEHYVGIEFVRGASDGGGPNGYHRMIGDPELLETLELFDQIKVCMVKDGKISQVMNQMHWDEQAVLGEDGADVMQCFPHMWAIIGGSNPIYERFIYSDQPFTYDGEVAEEILPWAESADFEVLVNNVPRCVYGATGTPAVPVYNYNTNIEYFENKKLGLGNFNANESLKNTITKTISKNPTAQPYPYYTATYFDLEVLLGILYVEFRTKEIHKLFNYGCTSGAPTNTYSSSWPWVNCIYCREKNRYYAASESFVYPGAVGSNTTYTNAQMIIQTLLGYNINNVSTLYAQMAVSANQEIFKNVYNSDGEPVHGKDNGVMTGICSLKFENVPLTMTFDKNEPCQEYHFDIVLAVALWRGACIFGDLYSVRAGYYNLCYAENENIHQKLFRAKNIEDDYNIIYSRPEGEWSSSDITTFDYLTQLDYVGDFTYRSGYALTEATCKNRTLVVSPHGKSTTYAPIYSYWQGLSESENIGTTIKLKTMKHGPRYTSYHPSIRDVITHRNIYDSEYYDGHKFRCQLS